MLNIYHDWTHKTQHNRLIRDKLFELEISENNMKVDNHSFKADDPFCYLAEKDAALC